MDINKLAPWNWFKKEQEQEGKNLPVVRQEASGSYPASPLFQVHQEIDRMFDDMFRSFGFPSLGFNRGLESMAQQQWLRPTLDIGASDKEYTVTVELPGVDEKEISLEVVNDTLRISGEKKQEKEEKNKNYYRMERSYGSFQRVLSLPDDADHDGIKAAFKNGVMQVTIPRKEAAKAKVKQIEVKTG